MERDIYDLNELRRIDAAGCGGYTWDDSGNGQRFFDMWGDRLHYIKSAKDDDGWMVWTGVWTGTHWQEDLLGETDRMALETAQHIRQDLRQVEDAAWLKEARKHVRYSASVMGMRNMRRVASALGSIPILPDAFDRNPWLLNCLSGTIDLRSGDVRPHDPNDMITRIARVGYNPAAACPQWEAFISEITCGDQELAAYLQRAVGYSLTGVTKEHALFYLYGKGGNGKSTFLGTLQALLGEYATTAAVGMLAARVGDRQTTDIADLAGARIVISHEAAKSRPLDEELIKTATGGDRLRCRHLYANNFEFTPQFKLWFDANNHPPLTDSSDGMWRRVKVIPFNASFVGREDTNLPERLLEELPGILAWAVRGCLDWQQHGLEEPEEVIAATTDYREQMDVVGRFLKSCCEAKAGFKVKPRDLYNRYRDWCAAAGESVMTETLFGTDMTERGFLNKKSNGSNWRSGLALL